jgi:hypothetical protein
MMRQLVMSIAGRVGVDTDLVEIVAVATEETYGQAVKDLFPGSGYTDNNGYLGVGKTKTHVIDGTPSHRILFNAYVMELCLRGFMGVGENIIDWPAELQYGPFIISHELGHCRFNETAPKDIRDLNALQFQEDDFDSINDHQFSVLVGEAGACFYGDRFYTSSLFKHSCEQELSPLNETKNSLDKAKTEKNIKNVAYLANGLSWLYPIQFTKIVSGIYKTGLEDSSILPPSKLTNFSETHNLLTLSVARYFKSELKDVAGFRENIDLVRGMILEHHLKVKISKENDGWSCFWH